LSAYIEGNVGIDGGRGFVGLGNTAEGDAEYQYLWKNGSIQDNIVSDVQREGECHFALCGGENYTISGNKLARVGRPSGDEDGNEPIYTKATHSIIEGNSFDHCGSHLIMLKGQDKGADNPDKSSPYGYGNIVRGNMAWGEGGTLCKPYTGDLLIEGNTAEGLDSLVSGGSNVAPIVVRNNMGTGLLRGGMTITGRAAHSVRGNVIHLAENPETIQTGITYRGDADGPARNASIVGNEIYGAGVLHSSSRGISLYCGSDLHYEIDGLLISNNRVRHLPYGIWSKGSGLPTFVGDGAWVRDNWLGPISSGIKDDPLTVCKGNRDSGA
ncbi:MAG: hypothetical protein DRJ50_15750, partial [Actinobacteria bacterium]